MTTRHLIHDVGHCLRAAALPALALGMLTALRGGRLEDLKLPVVGCLLVLAWQVAVVASVVWLFFAVSWATTRPWRDRRAHRRLHALRDGGRSSDRALVHLQTTIWSCNAGQLVTVIDIDTGTSHRLWLPEGHLPVGAFALLEKVAERVRVVDWIGVRAVEAGQRHERRHARRDFGTSAEVSVPCEQDGAAALIREAEEFLRST